MQAWNECASRLVDVAAGRAPADTLIRNGRWVNVHSGEIAIVCGRFAAVGPDLSRTVGDNTRIVEAEGRYVLPGLCDAHMHVESGMVTVTEFARAVIPHGTTSLFIDPHEIGNVLGLDGVRLMQLAATMRRRILAHRSRPTLPVARLTTTKARGRKMRLLACARACARCCGWGRRGMTLPSRSRR